MSSENLGEKLLVQMSGEELVSLIREGIRPNDKESSSTQNHISDDCRYVYGIKGIADLFGCSVPTANKIKKSGSIDKAITQIGRKIIVDAKMAIELAGRK